MAEQRGLPSPENGLSRRWEVFWLGAIVVLGLALRLYDLGGTCYWQDEIHGILRADHIGLVLTEGYLVSNHPPLYPVLLAGWRAVGLGDTEAANRLLTVLMGIGAFLTAYALGRRFFSPQVGLFGAFLMAISPAYVLHSRELKDYMLLPMTAPLAAMALEQAFRLNRRRDWVVYGLCVALVCYSETFAAFLLIGFGAWSLTQFPGRWSRLPGWIGAHGAGIAAFLPFIIILLGRTDKMIVSAGDWWIPSPTLYTLFLYVKTLVTGYTHHAWIYVPAGLLLLGLALAGGMLAVRQRPGPGLLIVLWAVVPVLVVAAVSWVVNSLFLYRALLAFGVPLLLLAGLAAEKMQRRWGVLGVGALFGLAAAAPLMDYYADRYGPLEFPLRPGIHPSIDRKVAAQYILDHWQAGDQVIQTHGRHWTTMNFYGLEGLPHQVAGYNTRYFRERFEAEPISHLTGEAADHWRKYYPAPLDPMLEGEGRIWLVLGEWERAYLGNNPLRVWRRTDARLRQIAHKRIDDLELFLYVRKEDAPVLGRDKDRGLRAEVLYGGAYGGVHSWARPDVGLIRNDAQEADALELRFDGSTAGAPAGMGQVGFEVANHSGQERTYRLIGRFSDVLVDACSMAVSEESNPLWSCNSWFNPAPPPRDFALSAMSAALDENEEAHMFTVLPRHLAGDVRLTLAMLDSPGDAAAARAALTLRFNGQPWQPVPGSAQMPRYGWGFCDLGTGSLPDSPEIGLEVAAVPNRELEKSYVDLAYVRLRRAAADASENLDVDWRSLAPGAVHRFEMKAQTPASRVDVWLLEQSEGVNGRHIFRMLDESSVQGG